jgi:hypothetical protein
VRRSARRSAIGGSLSAFIGYNAISCSATEREKRRKKEKKWFQKSKKQFRSCWSGEFCEGKLREGKKKNLGVPNFPTVCVHFLPSAIPYE